MVFLNWNYCLQLYLHFCSTWFYQLGRLNRQSSKSRQRDFNGCSIWMASGAHRNINRSGYLLCKTLQEKEASCFIVIGPKAAAPLAQVFRGINWCHLVLPRLHRGIWNTYNSSKRFSWEKRFNWIVLCSLEYSTSETLALIWGGVIDLSARWGLYLRKFWGREVSYI